MINHLKSVPRKHKEHAPNTVCARCGKEFYIPNSQKRKGENHYCSRRCNGKVRVQVAQKANLLHPEKLRKTEEEKQHLRERFTGERNPAWKGGVMLTHHRGNYKGTRDVRCPREFGQMARSNGYVAEHRLVVAQALGRPLLRTEVVHHVNHNPMDNRLENLMLFKSNKDHKMYEANGSPQPLWQG